MIYVGTGAGIIYAISFDGKKVWKKDVGGAIIKTYAKNGKIIALTNTGDIILLNKQGTILSKISKEAKSFAIEGDNLYILSKKELLRYNTAKICSIIDPINGEEVMDSPIGIKGKYYSSDPSARAYITINGIPYKAHTTIDKEYWLVVDTPESIMNISCYVEDINGKDTLAESIIVVKGNKKSKLILNIPEKITTGKIKINVTDEKGYGIEGVLIKINERKYRTNEYGIANVVLDSGENKVVLSKSGYEESTYRINTGGINLIGIFIVLLIILAVIAVVWKFVLKK